MRFLLLTTLLLPLTAWASGPETAKVSVNGLVCAFCAQTIEQVLKASGAVNTVHVDFDAKLVTVQFLADKSLDDTTLTHALEDAGYSVTGIVREKP